MREHGRTNEKNNFNYAQTDSSQSGATWKWWLNWLRLIGIALAVYVALEYVLPVVFPFCVGFLLAWALYPLRCWLVRRLHIRHEAAGYLAFFSGLLLAVMVLCALGTALFVGGNYISSYASADALVSQGRALWNACCEWLHTFTGRWVMQPEDYRKLIQAVQSRSLHIDPVQMLDNWQQFGGQTMRLLAYGLVTVVSTLLILKDFEELKKELHAVLEGLFHEGFGKKLCTVGRTYVKAQLCIMGIITVICIAGLFLARVPHFFLLGVGIGICDALPFLGTGICFLPWALWRFVTGRYVSGVWFIALYAVTSLARQVLEPRLIGEKIGVSPLAVLLSIYIGMKIFSTGGFLLGPISAFLIWQIYSGKAAREDKYANHSKNTGTNDSL